MVIAGHKGRRGRKLEETKRVARLLKMLELLAHGPISRKQLADQLGVTERQITLDLQLIRHGLGLAITRERRGYVMKSPPKLATKSLDFENALVLVMSLKAAIETGALPRQSAQPTVEALVGLFPEALRNYIRSYMEAESALSKGPAPGPVDMEYLGRLVRAIEQRRRVQVTYVASTGNQATVRTVDPYSLVLYQGSWELIGYCHLRNDIRIFNVARIKKLAILQETFAQMAADPRDLLRDAWGVVVSQEDPVDVSLLFDAKLANYIAERRWHDSQQVDRLTGGNLRLRLRVRLTEDFVGWILGFGPLVEVEQPWELRQRVLRQAQDVVRLYLLGAEEPGDREAYHFVVPESIAPKYSGLPRE